MFAVGSPVWMLILGVLLGFLAAWAFDYFYWRRRAERQIQAAIGQSAAELARLRDEHGQLQADLRACGERGRSLEAAVRAAEGRVAELTPLAAGLAPLQAERDRLAAGLGACEARAGELAAANSRLEATLAELRAAPAEVAIALGAAEAEPDLRGLSMRLADENALISSELAATKTALLRVARAQPDPLIDISGIGPAYQSRLYDAGIVTFEQVGAMTPAQLRAIIQPADWQAPAFAAWIAEARRRIGQPERDALIDIDGIGPVYERRLLAAGVATFAQLAALSPAQVREIVSPAPWQQIAPEAWIAEARQRMGQPAGDGDSRTGGRS